MPNEFTPYRVLFTPASAERVMKEEMYALQRDVMPYHAEFLAETQRRGEFDADEPIRFGVLRGQRYLVDGRHRLSAIIISGIPQSMWVIETPCATDEDLAQLYARIDRGRGRSMGDALKGIGAFNRIDGLSQPQMTALVACAPLLENGLTTMRVSGSSYQSKSVEGRLEVIQPWLEAAKLFFTAVKEPSFGSAQRLFYRRNVLPIALATFQDFPAKTLAWEFWHGMAKDDAIPLGDPRKACIEMLRSETRLVKAALHEQNRRTGMGYTAHAVTFCWNAWYREVPVKRIRLAPDAEGQPVCIFGTRFEHRVGETAVPQQRQRKPAVVQKDSQPSV